MATILTSFQIFVEREFYKPELNWFDFIHKADEYYQDIKQVIKYDFYNDKNKLTELKDKLQELYIFLCVNMGDTQLDFSKGLTVKQKNEMIEIEAGNKKVKHFDAKLIWYKVYNMKVFIMDLFKICGKQMDLLSTSAKDSTSTQALKQILKSFESTSLLTEPKLKTLHSKLIEKNYIAKNDFGDFNAIFKAEAIENFTPTKWIAEPVLLAYFIGALRELNLIARHKKIWVVAGKVFSNDSNLRQLKEGYQNNKTTGTIKGTPKNSDEIDNILSIL